MLTIEEIPVAPMTVYKIRDGEGRQLIIRSHTYSMTYTTDDGATYQTTADICARMLLAELVKTSQELKYMRQELSEISK